MLPAPARTGKKGFGKEGGRGWPRSHPEEDGKADACCKVSLLATKLEGGSPKN
jgi:hypothetical protein